jgi:hypothetical protein
MPYSSGERPMLKDVIRHKGTQSPVGFVYSYDAALSTREDMIAVRWDDNTPTATNQPASEYVLITRY